MLYSLHIPLKIRYHKRNRIQTTHLLYYKARGVYNKIVLRLIIGVGNNDGLFTLKNPPRYVSQISNIYLLECFVDCLSHLILSRIFLDQHVCHNGMSGATVFLHPILNTGRYLPCVWLNLELVIRDVLRDDSIEIEPHPVFFEILTGFWPCCAASSHSWLCKFLPGCFCLSLLTILSVFVRPMGATILIILQ
jgi:hypothetical protein